MGKSLTIQVFGTDENQYFQESKTIAICLSNLFPDNIKTKIYSIRDEDEFFSYGLPMNLASWHSINSSPYIRIIDSNQMSIDIGDNFQFAEFVRDKYGLLPPSPSTKAKRLFIAGDSSQVGKSTICIGILGTLLKEGYRPEELAYIKPATQCEAVQLISKYCKEKGIKYSGLGPIRFYTGFTREFLNGNTLSSKQMLEDVVSACDSLSNGCKVLIIDGVGYPAVGSICGVSNADIAKACEASVIIVGKKGVGNAIDSFNLNATYFESSGVRVLGGIFNKIPNEGFYSLENCKTYITSYFHQYRPNQTPYGFIPEFQSSERINEEKRINKEKRINGEFLNSEEYEKANKIVNLVSQQVNVKLLIADLIKTHLRKKRKADDRNEKKEDNIKEKKERRMKTYEEETLEDSIKTEFPASKSN